MPRKKTTPLSLKPVEKELQAILSELKRQAGRPKLTPRQAKMLARDIKKIKKLIKLVPPTCHGYDLGI